MSVRKEGGKTGETLRTAKGEQFTDLLRGYHKSEWNEEKDCKIYRIWKESELFVCTCGLLDQCLSCVMCMSGCCLIRVSLVVFEGYINIRAFISITSSDACLKCVHEKRREELETREGEQMRKNRPSGPFGETHTVTTHCVSDRELKGGGRRMKMPDQLS